MVLRDYLFGASIAYVRDNCDTPDCTVIAAALLCELTPQQLKNKIVKSGKYGNVHIDNFIDEHSPRGRRSDQWISYFGGLMAELFRVSGLNNYQLLLNTLSSSKHKDVSSLFKTCAISDNSEYFYVNDLSPKFIAVLEQYMQELFDERWHEAWTMDVYDEIKAEPNKEKFAKFITLGKEFGDAKGLEICPNQTFGVEIEVTVNRTYKIPDFNGEVWLMAAKQIIETLNQALGKIRVYQKPTGYHELEDCSQWKVEYDSSVGWEIVSPILFGLEGAKEVKDVFLALNFLISEHDFLCIDYRCGLHLNIGTHITTNNEWRSFLCRYMRVEPGLLPLVAPSRILKYNNLKNTYRDGGNAYCQLISTNAEIMNEYFHKDIENDLEWTYKYRSIRLKNLSSVDGNVNLLEVRFHNGTTSYLATLTWIALWMKIINYFEGFNLVEYLTTDPYDIHDNSDENVVDIISLLSKNSMQKISSKLKAEIIKRRRKMKVNWSVALPQKVESWERAGFFDDV